jgi:group I intron endonuclease
MEYPKILISGDYNVFNEGWNGCGVYMCSGNYASQTFKQPIYIGSTKNLEQRLTTKHIPELNRNKHGNDVFQKCWNKHGKDNFVWYLLETTSLESQYETEQKYLDLYRPFVDEFGGFNFAKFVVSPMKGRKTSEETKRKQSLRKIGKPTWNKGIPMSEEAKLKASITKLGKHYSPKTEFKKGCSTQDKKVICIETGIVYNSIKEASKSFTTNPSSSYIASVCKGRLKRAYGLT